MIGSGDLTHREEGVIAGDLGEDDFGAIMTRLERDRAYWELVEVNAAVLKQAEDVIAQAGVRTLDAIHLASAVVFAHAAGMPLPFVTADAQQHDAAVRLGLEARWVG